MDLEQIKSMLLKMSKDCGELADKLQDEGKPLNSEERQLIRFSICPMINERAINIKSAFLIGDYKYFERAFDGFENSLRSFLD